MMNPYASLPDSAFWSRTVSDGDWLTSLDSEEPYLHQSDQVMSMGSCFAANLVPYLETASVQYVRTEKLPAFLQSSNARFNYETFSAAYGNLYSVRAMLQLVERANGRFVEFLDPWKSEQGYVDPLRPGMTYPAQTIEEYRAVIKSHLDCTRRAIQQANVLVLTLGLVEAWRMRDSGAVLPAAPGTIAGEFSETEHELIVSDYESTVEDLIKLRDAVLEINSGMRFLVTVSPIPLVATATSENVVVANSYSKSVLRSAAASFINSHEDCRYVPSYEILIGAQVKELFFKADCRSVEEQGIKRVMRHFLRGLSASSEATSSSMKSLAEWECEEVLQAKFESGDDR